MGTTCSSILAKSATLAGGNRSGGSAPCLICPICVPLQVDDVGVDRLSFINRHFRAHNGIVGNSIGKPRHSVISAATTEDDREKLIVNIRGHVVKVGYGPI